MWSSAKGEENTGARRNELLQKGYELFSTKSIEAIGMRDVAKAVGCGSVSAYRYYGSKPEFVVAVAAWKWEQFQEENQKRRPNADIAIMTAAEIFEFYLDSFLELYRDHKDLLLFNQFLNVYVQSEHMDAGMAGIAMRSHIYDFIERPYGKDRLEQSIRDVIERCPNRNRWIFRSGYYER